MPSSQKTIVFDLDGTLVDSIRDLVPALNKTTELDGVPPLTLADVGATVGSGAMKMIELAYNLNNLPLSTERHKELFSIFLQNYEAHIADHTVFYEGALSALDDLASNGWILAVCTNKYEHYARDMLQKMGELSRFSAITGGDSFDFRKPDPAHLIETIKLAGGSPNLAIMVGDTTNDILAARAANIPSIAVDFGYPDVPVEEMKATTIISHYTELKKSTDDLIKTM
ncbi:MAG: HAD-IA family hydrolase [Rhizobiaceae bacterium]